MKQGALVSTDAMDLLNQMKDLEIKNTDVPKFTMPYWPKGVLINGYLGKKDYRAPSLQDNGLLSWQIGRHKISFLVDVKGAIRFDFLGSFKRFRDFPVFDRELCHGDYGSTYHRPVYWACSDHDKNTSRLGALILFNQFKTEVLLKVLAEIKSSSHNDVAGMITKAFEPFVPFAVADMLSE